MLPTIKIIALKDKEKHGLIPIYLQFTKNRKVNRISLSRKIPTKSWSGKEKYIIERGNNSYPNARIINKRLQENYLRAETIIETCIDHRKLSFEKFKSLFLKGEQDSFSYHSNRYIQFKKAKGVSANTVYTYYREVKRIKKYKNEFSLYDIDMIWISKMDVFLREELGLAINSIHRVHIYIRGVFNLSKISPNPFNDYQTRAVIKQKIPLSLQEVSLLEKTYRSSILRPVLQNVLEYFLFACYTGLSFSDLVNLKQDDIDKSGEMYIIRGIRQKSKADLPLYYIIPLIDKAAAIIDRQKTTKVAFLAISNQKTNKYLKEIAKFVGLRKNVTFHTARHTCATLLLNMGVQRNVVQRILGHKTAAMTDHYAKLIDSTVIEQLKNLNKNWSQ